MRIIIYIQHPEKEVQPIPLNITENKCGTNHHTYKVLRRGLVELPIENQLRKLNFLTSRVGSRVSVCVCWIVLMTELFYINYVKVYIQIFVVGAQI